MEIEDKFRGGAVCTLGVLPKKKVITISGERKRGSDKGSHWHSFYHFV